MSNKSLENPEAALKRDWLPDDPRIFRTTLRKAGDDGVHTYRIPGLATTPKGTLIAVFDLRHKHGFEAMLPLKDDFEAGINAVRLPFNQGKIVIHERCRFLIATLRGATFNKQRTDFARTMALGHMDALAALIYANRMIDRSTNPVPADLTFAERVAPTWMQKGKDAQSNKALAEALLNSFGRQKG